MRGDMGVCVCVCACVSVRRCGCDCAGVRTGVPIVSCGGIREYVNELVDE